MRTLFIGDVHGCYDELIELVIKIGLTPEDHLYFTGDVINKGPKSLEVVEFIRNRPNTWSVMGNHEYYVMMDPEKIPSDHRTPEIDRWIFTPETQERLAPLKTTLAPHQDWLTHLPLTIETPEFLLVHGGLHPDLGRETPVYIATLIREYEGKPWYEYYDGSKKIIYGHYAVDHLRIRENTIGLDTGCCFGGMLTAYCLESGEIWQVSAHDIYKIPMHLKEKIIKI